MKSIRLLTKCVAIFCVVHFAYASECGPNNLSPIINAVSSDAIDPAVRAEFRKVSGIDTKQSFAEFRIADRVRSAMVYLRDAPLDQKQKSELWESFASNLRSHANGTWNYSVHRGRDSSIIYMGGAGEMLIIRQDAKLFRGRAIEGMANPDPHWIKYKPVPLGWTPDGWLPEYGQLVPVE